MVTGYLRRDPSSFGTSLVTSRRAGGRVSVPSGRALAASLGPSPLPSLTSPSALLLSSEDKWLLLKNRVINFPPN